jgi:CheY-like chemotaxis protein
MKEASSNSSDLLPGSGILRAMAKPEAICGPSCAAVWMNMAPATPVPLPAAGWHLAASASGGSELGSDGDTAGIVPQQQGPLRLLIVEDEILTADYMQHLLLELGHEVCGHAINTDSALRLAKTCQPDLVLMDVNLGRGGDGITAAQQILERFGIRSLFVTAYGDRVTMARAQSAGPLGIVVKPFDKQRLAEAIAAARQKFGRTDG